MEKNMMIPNEPIALVGNENIKVRGRHTVVKKKYLAFDWTNSGFSFNFEGTGFMLSLGKYKSDAPAYVKIRIDGDARRQRFAVVNGSEKIIVEGLTDGRHRVDVLKVTEGRSKLLFESVTLFGLTAALKLPPNPSRRIEFIGDSITCGYGVLGSSSDPGYLTYQQDGTCTYAFMTADAFGADGRYICISGKGIVCNCEGNREDVKAGEYYEYLTYDGGVCRDGWIADAVVINIGTNDTGGPASKEEFAQAALDLISKVRARYPKAHIIWLYGMMNDYYLETLSGVIRSASADDRRLHMLHVEGIGVREGEVGANGHPNVRANARVADKLIKKISSLNGWRRVNSRNEEE